MVNDLGGKEMKLNLSIREMVIVGMCSALMGIFSQISIPLPFTTVPITLQIFGVVVIAVILGGKLATISMIIYTLLGCFGIPVFANFSAGARVVLGPTGGYIIGFIFMALVIGYSSNKSNKYLLWIGAYIGLMIDYLFGVGQLKIVLGLGIQEALVAGLYPFIIKDGVTVGVAVLVALVVKKSLKGAIKMDVTA